MALNYEAIRQENKTRYGTDISEYGKIFFEDTYADRTHFLFELLQNAEDAIARRGNDWDGPRQISFRLTEGGLRVGHFGDPFNESDVLGVCGITKSTKKESLTEIGRFGIGFKSVYAFTDLPEIHSGLEDFTIDHYVWPREVEPVADKDPEETVFILRFRPDVPSAYSEVDGGLRGLGIETLLYLRQIDEIMWENDHGSSGHYLRESEPVDGGVCRVTIVAQVDGGEDIHQEWLMFFDQVANDCQPAGEVAIAFSINPQNQRFQSIENSSLFAYFPTALKTQFGFLANGPYRTTLNRENVPGHESWNQHLVAETASLLVRSLRWLRDENRLDAAVLRCLPLTPWNPLWRHIGEGLLQPLFEKTKEALSSEQLLPKLGGGYISADRALIGRTATLRTLFSPEQISTIYGGNRELAWLDDAITQDPELSQYVTEHLDVPEVRPEAIVSRLSQTFLEAQTDEWIQTLYEFLCSQPALARRVGSIPLVRLSDGSHVLAKIYGKPQAYLPTSNETDFPTVARSVCKTSDALQFLRSIGLNEPDAVDDVIVNLIPKYRGETFQVDDDDYAADIQRILRAFDSSRGEQRTVLIAELSKTAFVRMIDPGMPSSRMWGCPNEGYLPADELTELFEGVRGFRFVDRSCECLRDGRFHQLLEACGTRRHMRPVEFSNDQRFGRSELQEMRIRTIGDAGSSRSESVKDWQLFGLKPLLATLPHLDYEGRLRKAKLLWGSLAEVNSRYFSGTYSWFYYTDRSCNFDAEFVELLNKTAWVPTVDGGLNTPEHVVFGDLGWEENSFLQSKIRFKPSTIRLLAQASGFDLGVLDLLKKLGITTTSELLEAIGDSGRQVAEDSDRNTGQVNNQLDEYPYTFGESLLDTMTPGPSSSPSYPVVLPEGGPNTSESAISDTMKSMREGRSGRRVIWSNTRFELTDSAQNLANRFRSMLQGDYGKRCQVCGASFLTRKGKLQTFADHIVDPANSSATNHFGNLLSLCGWHFALISHGRWVLLDPETGEPLKGSGTAQGLENLVNLPVVASEDIDDGNRYIAITVRFWNVYRKWRSAPEHIDEEIRFSIPHWKYFCELLNTQVTRL